MQINQLKLLKSQKIQSKKHVDDKNPSTQNIQKVYCILIIVFLQMVFCSYILSKDLNYFRVMERQQGQLLSHFLAVTATFLFFFPPQLIQHHFQQQLAAVFSEKPDVSLSGWWWPKRQWILDLHWLQINDNVLCNYWMHEKATACQQNHPNNIKGNNMSIFPWMKISLLWPLCK